MSSLNLLFARFQDKPLVNPLRGACVSVEIRLTCSRTPPVLALTASFRV